MIPVEIKYSSTYNQRFSKGIRKFQSITGLAGQGVVVYSGDFRPSSEAVKVLNYRDVASLF